MTSLQSKVHAARSGDRDALNDLFLELFPQISQQVHRALACDFRRSRPWLHSLFSTGDIVQEVLVGVLKDLKSLTQRDDRAIIRYLVVVTRNRLMDAIRFYEASHRDHRRAQAREELEHEAGGDPNPEDSAITNEQVAAFHRALQTFSERERTLLRERIEHSTPFEKLAGMLGYASADSARKMFSIAQAKLLTRIRNS